MDEGSYFDTEYYRIDTNISPTFGFALGSKIDLTIMFLFLCLLICFYFTYQYDKYRNNNVLKNMKPKIVEKDRDFLEHFTHISKWSAYFLLTGTLLFSFIVLSYFIGYIWFGLLSLKPYLIVGINLIIIPYIAVIYLINKKTRNKRDHFQERTSTINLMKQVSKIEISFKISLNEILGIIAVILALFLFVYGNWEFPLLIPP